MRRLLGNSFAMEQWIHRSRIYDGIDARVFLSDPFLDTHCFRIRPSRDADGTVGLAFEPVESREVSDVEGVLWLDEQTAELRVLEFT